jgi:DNA-binding NarL/FixJ family response regulator
VGAAAMIRVLVADDYAPMREQIRLALEEDSRFEVCAEAADAPGAIEAAVRERPDICLIDIRMPGNGISATWEITARLPETKVVILTVSRDEWDLFAALRAGASGYLLKDIDPRRLPHALYDVDHGEAAIPRSLVARILEEFRDRAPRRRSVVADAPEGKLTSREWEVLDLMRRELTTAEIAKRLVVSPATVRSHTAAIIKKLRVPDRESAVRLFEER